MGFSKLACKTTELLTLLSFTFMSQSLLSKTIDNPSDFIPNEANYLKSEGDHALFSKHESTLSGAITDEDLALVEKSNDIIKNANLNSELVEIRQQANQMNQALQMRNAQEKFNLDYSSIDNILLNTSSIIDQQFAPATTNIDDSQKAQYSKEPAVLWLFVSSSMTEMQMKKTLQTAVEWGARVVYRGLRPQDKNLHDMTRFVYEQNALLEKFQKKMLDNASQPEESEMVFKSGIFIDPMAFTKFDITAVPSMIYERIDANGNVNYGKVRGLISATYLQDKTEQAIQDGTLKNGVLDLGEMGRVTDIKEKDFVDELKARTAKLDLNKLQKEAVDRHWERRQFEVLPPSQQDIVLELDPTFVVNSDVKAKDGTVIARKGDKFNPLHYIPQSMTMFVFDGTDPKELAFIEQQVSSPIKGHVKLITTRVDKSRGFEHLQEIYQRLKRPITLLTPEIIKHFNLTATPVKVYTSPRAMYEIEYFSQQTVRRN